MKHKALINQAPSDQARSPGDHSELEEVIANDPTLQTIAHSLSRADLSHRSEIRVNLRSRLIEEVYHSGEGTIMSKRKLRIVVATLTLILAFGLAMPSLSALAQSWLAKVGVITVTNDEEHFATAGFNPAEPTATPIPANAQEQLQTELLDPVDGPVLSTMINTDQAAALAGFDIVREPSYLPAGYAFGGRAALGNVDQVSVDSTFAVKDSMGKTFLSISQSRGIPESTWRVGGEASAHELTIADLTATFIEQADLSASDGRLFNILLWEEGDYIFAMISPSLSEAEMLRVAESMYP